MNLSFDNLDELQQFLGWASGFTLVGDEIIAPGVLKFPTLDTGLAASVGVEAEGLAAGQVAFDTPSADTGGTKPADNPEPAKRKRRTKAEIEADEKAAADAAGANLKDAAASDDKAAEDEQAPTGTNPFEQAAAAGGEPASEAGDAVAAEEPGETVVTPFQHLTRAREFIAKHGMPKYNESFTKAGLDANVMGYSAFQRALHMTALDELDKG